MTPDFHPGDRIRARDLGLTGTFLRAQGGRVLIETDRGRVSVSPDGLEPAPAAPRAAATGETRITLETGARAEELDLHGATVAEVEPAVASFIDQAVVRGAWRVRIIHGTGQGLVLAEVRRCLKGHPAVRSFEFAAPHEGSVGATVAVIA